MHRDPLPPCAHPAGLLGRAGTPQGGRGSLGSLALVTQGRDRCSLLPPWQMGGLCHFSQLHNQGWGKRVGNYSLEMTLVFKASRSFLHSSWSVPSLGPGLQ